MPDVQTAVLAAIRHWHRQPELAEYAESRHGYGDSDGGFGVTYPGDLDEFAREVERVFIPPGHVAVYGYWGPPDGYELLVPESEYLRILAAELAATGLIAESMRVEAISAGSPSKAESD